MKIGLIINEDRDKNFEYTKKLLEDMSDIKVLIFDKFKNFINNDKVTFINEKELFINSNFIVILGGDGTILRWSKKIAKYNKNILGINIGNLGYLTDVNREDAKKAIQKVVKGDYIVEKRMMIKATINGMDYLALNEVNINNGNTSRMVSLGIDINGKFVDDFNADGLIISTPTGSTAYNLSAGGPILKPDTKLMAITYVCPHALFTRPYVISADDKIRVYITNEDILAYLSLDGQQSIPIKYGDSVYIEKSQLYTNIIKTTHLNFYEILRKKMFERKG